MTLLPMPPFLPETATSETQLETIAAGRGQAGLARDRRNSRVGHRTRAETGRWRGKLLPADWRVKRNLAGAVVEGCRAGETGPSLAAIRAPACRQTGQIGNEEVAWLPRSLSASIGDVANYDK